MLGLVLCQLKSFFPFHLGLEFNNFYPSLSSLAMLHAVAVCILFFPNKDLEVDYEKQEKKEGVIIKTKYSSMFSSSPSSLPLMSKPTIQQIECTCKISKASQ